MENESSIKDIITNSLHEIRTIIDADTIVGKQIVTESGVVIIPISKLSMGFASGGLDIPHNAESGVKSFGGGGGTGVTVSPIGFLTVSPDGKVEMLPISQDKGSTLDQVLDLINQAPDLIKRIKGAVCGDDCSDEAEAELIAKEAELAAELAAELGCGKAMTKKEERIAAKEAKKAQKAEKKAAKAAKRAALEDEDDEDEYED